MHSKKQEEDFVASLTSLIDSSESKYKSGDFKGSIEDRRKAELLSKNIIDSKAFKELINKINPNKSKYNLIEDYKKRIDDKKKKQIVIMLENISMIKYNKGDYKGSIRALRRAEKYY
tara:strand:+ start:1092 stop:1442 length:351 start_codon:yes stop_codon:yes gene_type:complete